MKDTPLVDEPDDLWEAQRFLRARDHTTWAKKVPSTRRGHRRDYVGQTNPRLEQGKLIGSIVSPGFVFAASPEDGKILWRHRIEHRAHDNVASDGDYLYVVSWNHLRSIRIEDGRRRWKYFPPFESKGRLWSPPLLHEDSVYLFDREGSMQRVDKENGKCVWRTQIAEIQRGYEDAPIVIGDCVVTRANPSLLIGCEIGSGKMIWRTQIERGGWGGLQEFGGQLLVSDVHGFAVVNPKDGSVSATWNSSDEDVRFCLTTPFGILVVVESKVSIPLPECRQMRYAPGRLVLLDDSFRERWSLPYTPYASPLLRYEAKLSFLLEVTASGLGMVDLETGVRSAVFYGFPCETDREIGLPCSDGDGLYGLTRRGILFRLDMPVISK